MGMSASQARLLFISSRKNDIELKSQQIANQKIRLASESEQISTDYANALNKTKLVFNGMGANGEQISTDLAYNSIMSPDGALSGKYTITDSRGRSVVSTNVQNAFEQAHGNPILFMQALCGDEDLSGVSYTSSGTQMVDNPNSPIYATVDHWTINETALSNASNQYVDRVADQAYRSYHDSFGGTTSTTSITRTTNSTRFTTNITTRADAYVEENRLAMERDVVARTADIERPSDYRSETTSSTTSTLTTGTTSETYSTERFASTERTAARTAEYARESEARSTTTDTADGRGTTTSTSTRGTGTRGTTTTSGTSTGRGTATSTSTRGTGTRGTTTTSGTSTGRGSTPTRTSTGRGSTPTRTSTGRGSTPTRTSTGRGTTTITLITTQTTRLTEAEFKSVWKAATYGQALGTTGTRIASRSAGETNETHYYKEFYNSHNNPNDAANHQYCTNNQTQEITGYNQMEVPISQSHSAEGLSDVAQYYYDLFCQLEQNGYTAFDQAALNNNDMLQAMLENGDWFINQKNSDNTYTQKSISELTSIQEVSDKDGFAKAEAEYNAKTAKINKKEKQLDMELKKLDTEHSALQTEEDSVKNLIKDNVDKTFNMFS